MTETGTYKRNILYTLKGEDIVFEIVRVKKLKVGWSDYEYKEVGRMKEGTWNKLRDNQNNYLQELKEEHLTQK